MTLAGCTFGESPADPTDPTDRTATATDHDRTATATDLSRTATATDFETPQPGECDPRNPPTPDPTVDGLEPRSYPAFPDFITAGTAVSFAENFERAYRHNAFVEEHADTGYDELQVLLGAELVDERDVEYVVRVDGELLFADEERPETATETPYPTGTVPFVTWYFLADRFALRKGVDRGLPDDAAPDFTGADVVVCDG